jgi:7-carboxy-7-deazaguanine synthase
MTVEEAYQEITKWGTAKHVVITGGEPFLQKDELILLCDRLTAAKKYHITIETNATLFAPVKANLISMSPKLSSSTPTQTPLWTQRHEQERLQRGVIRQFLDQYECQVKFVIDHQLEIAEVNQLVKDIPIPKETVILMPQGINETFLKKQQQWLVEVCKEQGYRYSPRLHIQIWGNERGR